MKNTKKCPKCQSSDIVKIKGECGPYGRGNNIAISGRTPVLVTRYLCCSCGFSEEWINQGDIKNFVEGKNGFDRYSKEFHDDQPTTHPMSYIILKITAVMVIAFIISLLLMWLLIYLKR